MKKNSKNNTSDSRGAGRFVSMFRVLVGLGCGISAAFAFAQTGTSGTGLTVSIPNGYAHIAVDDMKVMSTGGPVRWSRAWDGKEWKFNAHWESLSQNWTNMTGSVTGSTSGADAVTQTLTDTASGCWVLVDEDWKPSSGTVLIDGKPAGAPMLPERTAPFNRVMGESQNDYPPPRIVSVDYHTLCKGMALTSSPVQDVEALRLKNELYLGESGRYAFSNRSVLEKRAVNALPVATAAVLDSQLAAGRITLAPVTIGKGFRWMDKGGQWIDYNTQGQVVAYGDRNDNIVWMARDTEGILRGIVDANGRVVYTIHYTGALVTEVRDYPIAGMALDLPARSVKYQYDAASRLSAVIDVRGNTTRYAYDTNNRIVGITDQEGRVETLVYTGSSVSKRTAPDGGVTDYVFEYDEVNKQFISRVTGPETSAGRRVEDFTHNRSGKLVRRTVNGRLDEEVRYDTGARTELHTNARGYSSRTSFNEYDQVVQQVREDGTGVKLTYSAMHLGLTTITDSAGMRTENRYDGKGNLIKTVEAAGTPDERVTEYEVNQLGQIVKVIKKGRVESIGTVTMDAITLVDYDAQGNQRTLTEPEGGVYQFESNRLGNIVRLTDPRGHASTFEFDREGRLVKSTDAMNHSRIHKYDKVGNVIALTDPAGRESQLSYDGMNRLVQVTNALNASSEIQYDTQGQAITVTDADGRKTQAEYDNFQRLSKQIDALGNITRFGYQIADGTNSGILGSLLDPTEIVFPTYTQRNRYDSLERPTSVTLVEPQANDRATSFGYTPRGDVRSETDAYGKSNVYELDSFGKRLLETDKLGNKTRFQYDVRGNLIQLTDAKGNIRKYEYDRNDRVKREIFPLGQFSSKTYDAAGNVLVSIDPNGNKKEFSYDPLGRLTGLKQYDASNSLVRTVSYMWGATHQFVGWSDNHRGNVASGVVTYDEVNRKTGETVTYPGGFTMSYLYSYSHAGKKIQMKWPDGTVIGYGYSAHGELATVSVPGEGTLSVNEFKWTVPTETVLPGGTVQKKQYDGLLNLTSVSVKSPSANTLLSLSNNYGALQEPTKRVRSDTDSGETTITRYTYDDEIRLISVTGENGGLSAPDTETFTLDALANRVSHSRAPGPWIYDANNRLKQQGTGAEQTTYDYDDAGNVIRRVQPDNKTTEYSYDQSNRLIEVRSGVQEIVARYGYDPMGRRIWKEQFRDRKGATLLQATRTYFLYADEGLVAEASQPIKLNLDGSVSVEGVPILTTQYGLRPDAAVTTDVLFIKTKNSNGENTVAYYQHDHLGTPIQAIDRRGNIVWAAKYDAFGRAEIITAAPTAESPTIVSLLRFPGQIEDVETGLHYNSFRDYDPSTGRYIQSDPLGMAGGNNTYAYVRGNPVMLYDPLGLWSWGDPLPENFVNAVTGFGDGIGIFGFSPSKAIREGWGIDGGVNVCSPEYRAGHRAGDLYSDMMPGVGRVGYMTRIHGMARRATSVEAAYYGRRAIKAEYRSIMRPIIERFDRDPSLADILRKAAEKGDAYAIARSGVANSKWNRRIFGVAAVSSAFNSDGGEDCECQ